MSSRASAPAGSGCAGPVDILRPRAGTAHGGYVLRTGGWGTATPICSPADDGREPYWAVGPCGGLGGFTMTGYPTRCARPRQGRSDGGRTPWVASGCLLDRRTRRAPLVDQMFEAVPQRDQAAP